MLHRCACSSFFPRSSGSGEALLLDAGQHVSVYVCTLLTGLCQSGKTKAQKRSDWVSTRKPFCGSQMAQWEGRGRLLEKVGRGFGGFQECLCEREAGV